MTHFKSNLMIAKSVLATSLVAGTLLVSGAAFASPESTQNGIPVMETGIARPVTEGFTAYSNAFGYAPVQQNTRAVQYRAAMTTPDGAFDPANGADSGK